MWQADYAIYSHVAADRTAGLSPTAGEALRAGRPEGVCTDDQLVAYRVTEELSRTRTLGDETYERACERLGRTQVLDLVSLIGIYTATAIALQAFAGPAPPADGPLVP